MARLDLESLRAAGFTPTDADVVRLNDLAMRIEISKDTTAANMPRVAFAGNVILHEPTYAGLEWWHNFGRDAAWTTRGKLNTYYYMLARCATSGAFDGLEEAGDIRRAVRKWAAKVYATEVELWRALLYVKRVDGSEQPAPPSDPLDDERQADSLFRSLIAAAGAAGVSPESLKTETRSTLVSMLVHANLTAHIPMKASVARDYIAYQQAIRDIESRKEAK